MWLRPSRLFPVSDQEIPGRSNRYHVCTQLGSTQSHRRRLSVVNKNLGAVEVGEWPEKQPCVLDTGLYSAQNMHSTLSVQQRIDRASRRHSTLGEAQMEGLGEDPDEKPASTLSRQASPLPRSRPELELGRQAALNMQPASRAK